MTHDFGGTPKVDEANIIDAKREIPFELEYLDGKAWQVETYAQTPLSSCTPVQMERVRTVTGGERVTMPSVAYTGERIIVGCRKEGSEVYSNFTPWKSDTERESDEGNRPSAQCQLHCTRCARHGVESLCTFSRGHRDAHACHLCAFDTTLLTECSKEEL